MIRALIYVAVLAVLIAGPASFGQVPLGDVARQQRATPKKALKVITNDDLPIDQTKADAKASDSTDSSAKDAAAAASTPKQGKKGAVLPLSPAEEVKATQREFQARYAEQQRVIDRLTRESNLLQHEYDLQTTAYWADAGNSLRDGKLWYRERKKYEEQLEAKQKQLEDARKKLDSIREAARRAGVAEQRLEE